MPDELDAKWVGRLQAAGRAQARYLWILLIAGLFYAALFVRFTNPPTPVPPLRVPFINLELSAPTLIASGPAIIAFLVVVVMGAIRAYSHAQDKLDITNVAGAAEPLDVHPNALDFAAYTTERTPKWLATILYFVYPTYLAAALLEAAWLWVNLAGQSGDSIPGRTGFLTVAVPIWIAGLWQVGESVTKRIARAWRGGHLRQPPSE